jgi:hypothetical protein
MDTGFLKRNLSALDEEHLRSNSGQSFGFHAKEALRRVLRALRTCQINALPVGGTLLGWYRQCDVIEHTKDLDLLVREGCFVSLRHFDLFVVWWWS